MSLQGYLNSFPAYTPRSPSSSSIRSSWLYFASRSDLLGAPVLICPVPSPTTRSAMKESSVSPERCETITPQWQSLLCSQAWMDSETVPIWLTLSRRALQDFFWMPVLMRCWFVTNRSSPTICTFSPSLAVSARYPSQSSWSNGSSIDTIGYLLTQRSYSAPSSLLSRCGTDCDSFSSLKCRSYFLVVSLQNSEAAQSMPISTRPLCPEDWMAACSSSSASSPSLTVGAKPPSSPTLVAFNPYFFLMIFMRWWQTSDPTRIACVKLEAPVGRIMNSCMASPLPPCLPPLITLKAGVGRMNLGFPVRLVRDWMCWQRGTFLAAAPARATARETERMALAPISFLQQPQSLKVPSNSRTIQLSISVCLIGSLPTSAGESTLLTFPTALETPLPMYSSFLPSRSSTASYFPVDAPDGTEARKTPRSVVTSASMVGFPLESKICRALMCLIVERQQWSGLARILIILLLSYLPRQYKFIPPQRNHYDIILSTSCRNAQKDSTDRNINLQMVFWLFLVDWVKMARELTGHVIGYEMKARSFQMAFLRAILEYSCGTLKLMPLRIFEKWPEMSYISKPKLNCRHDNCPQESKWSSAQSSMEIQPLLSRFVLSRKCMKRSFFVPAQRKIRIDNYENYQQQRWKCFLQLVLSTTFFPPSNPVRMPAFRC